VLHFSEKGGDGCIDVIHDFVVKNGSKHISMAYSQGAQKTDILKEVSFLVISSLKYLVFLLVYSCHKSMTETQAPVALSTPL
jgi:hypothetical protein